MHPATTVFLSVGAIGSTSLRMQHTLVAGGHISSIRCNLITRKNLRGHQRFPSPLAASGWQFGSSSHAPRFVSPLAHAANTEYSDGCPILNQREEEYQEKGIDVLGLGQAMIDFGASVDENWLVALEASKGCRKCVLLIYLSFKLLMYLENIECTSIDDC